jgi:DNA-binding NtrC family response regulator
VRELKNFAHRLTVLVREDVVTSEIIRQHLNIRESYLPTFSGADLGGSDEGMGGRKEIEMLAKMILDVREEVNDIKRVLAMGVSGVNQYAESQQLEEDGESYIIDHGQRESQRGRFQRETSTQVETSVTGSPKPRLLEQPLNLEINEKELISRSLNKNKDNRKKAAQELGISERTLYRKIRQYDLG